jgi:hypothetical protein
LETWDNEPWLRRRRGTKAQRGVAMSSPGWQRKAPAQAAEIDHEWRREEPAPTGRSRMALMVRGVIRLLLALAFGVGSVFVAGRLHASTGVLHGARLNTSTSLPFYLLALAAFLWAALAVRGLWRLCRPTDR